MFYAQSTGAVISGRKGEMISEELEEQEEENMMSNEALGKAYNQEEPLAAGEAFNAIV